MVGLLVDLLVELGWVNFVFGEWCVLIDVIMLIDVIVNVFYGWC